MKKPISTKSRGHAGKPLAGTPTCILRVVVRGAPSISRDIEIGHKASLYELAEAIVGAFDFDFDHAFGFYSGKTRRTFWDAQPKYELFADMGEESDALSVKRTAIAEAFPKVGHALTFLFDYGDEWHFPVKLISTGTMAADTRYPQVIARRGESPPQYPDPDDEDE